MPLYAYRCPSCGRDEDAFARIDEMESAAPRCCGAPMRRQITAPMVQVPGGLDVRYVCPMSGEQVTSMRRRKYLMQKYGVVDSRELKDTWQRSLQQRKCEKEEAQRAYDALPDAVKKVGEQARQAPLP